MATIYVFPNLRLAEARAESEARSTGNPFRVVACWSDRYGLNTTWEVWPVDRQPRGFFFGGEERTWTVVRP